MNPFWLHNGSASVTSSKKGVLSNPMKNQLCHTLFLFRRHFLIGASLCVIFTLSACSSTPVEPQKPPPTQLQLQQQQRFLQGKNLYLNKQYGEAASILLPLAQQGHMDAQYTVGYMYHYGYGVPRNEKESTRWINMAAARGHLLAKQALIKINAVHDQNGVIAVPAANP